MSVLPATLLALLIALAFASVHFLTGCTLIEKANSDGKLVEALKETYANGGASAVSNKIESLVASGTLSVKQAAALHTAAQRLYDRVLDRLETTAEE